jgi:3',5'-cyclic AMP phosphodiesterase CpdA
MQFAHLSDLHALDLAGVSPLQFINKRLAGWINLLRKRRKAHPLAILEALCTDLNQLPLSHVVITGDLSNLSLPAEFRRARAAIDRIELGPREVTVIPGNHDVYVWEALFRRHFDRAFAAYASGDEAPAGSLPSYPFVRLRGEVAFIGTSTARPSPPPLADGRLGGRQLRELEATLAALRGKFRVLLIHHPPLPQSLDVLRALRDRKALHAVLRRVGCELVLHGHEHRDLRGELPGPSGPIPVIGVGSGTYEDGRPGQLDRRARYNIYTVTGSASTGFSLDIAQRVHDPASGRFIPYLPPGAGASRGEAGATADP